MGQSATCLLGEYLTYFIQICNNEKTLSDLFGSNAMYDDYQQFTSVFNVLTESKFPTINTVFNRTTKQKRKYNYGLISEDMILTILYFLFPDADEQKVRKKFYYKYYLLYYKLFNWFCCLKQKFPYSSNFGFNEDDKQSRGIKTCPLDSLVWRLGIVAAHCTYNLGGVEAFAQLWQEFLLEIRFRWEKGLLIPG